MEAAPRLPTVNFDLKLAIDIVNVCEKVPQFIQSHYHDQNDMSFVNECEQINRLRQNAINAGADETSVKDLKRYFCQLLLMKNRFPMLPDAECAVRFTWEDAFQKEENTFNDIRFEEASILYNLGVIYSKLGNNETRKTHESMKNACTYYRCAAGCLEKIRNQYSVYSVDFTGDLLTCQVDILLGQAHEAVLEKSLFDQRPPTVNAHIAKQISEYYQTALTNLLKPDVQSIGARRFREWRVALTFKISYYLAVTYFCLALVAEEKKKRGEAVCYYENAVEQLKDAWKNATKISSDKSSIFKEGYTFVMDFISEKLRIAKRDNDNVYFEKVPTLNLLPVIQGAVVAKPQFFDCQDQNVSGPDLFQNLIPMNAHLVASEYSEEKSKLLREIVELTDEKNRELETFLPCLQLDRLPLNHEYLRLPRDFLDCYAAAATRPTMSKELVVAMQQLNSEHHDVAEQIDVCEDLLRQINETSNEDLKQIEIDLKNLRDLLSQANETNTELHRHVTKIFEHLKILHSPLEQLERMLPTITELDDEVIKPKLARLGLLSEKIETMKKQRELLLKDFRQKIQDDNITKLLLIHQQENHKDLFASEMKKYDEIVGLIKQNCRAQENLIQAMTEANADLADRRSTMIKAFESRQRLIQETIGSYRAFDDTMVKANEGLEFYKKQTEKLMTIHQRLTKLKSQQMAKPVCRPASPPKPMATVVDRPRLKDYLATMKPETWAAPPIIRDEATVYRSTVPMTNHNTNVQTFTQQYQVPSAAPTYSAQHAAVPSYAQTNYFNTNPSFYPTTQYFPPVPTTYQSVPMNYSSVYPTGPPPPPPTQSLPPLTRFDPYRPQPVGAYEIPSSQPAQSIGLINPQDVYRPGGLFRLAQTSAMGTSVPPTVNRISDDQNQYVPTSSFANLSLNPMLNH